VLGALGCDQAQGYFIGSTPCPQTR
jgi:hypothetical protein